MGPGAHQPGRESRGSGLVWGQVWGTVGVGRESLGGDGVQDVQFWRGPRRRVALGQGRRDTEAGQGGRRCSDLPGGIAAPITPPRFRYVGSWLNPRTLGREGRVSPTPGGEKPDQPDHPPTPS